MEKDNKSAGLQGLADAKERKIVREPIKPIKLKPGEVLGRDGEILRRNRNFSANQFELPDHIKEPGWSYQWNTASVYGQPNPAEINRMLDNGWRFVSASNPRFKSFFGADATTDRIELDGLVLMERPQTLTNEALSEMRKAADDQYMRQFERADTDMNLPEGYKATRRKIKKGDPEKVDPDLYPERRARIPDDND